MIEQSEPESGMSSPEPHPLLGLCKTHNRFRWTLAVGPQQVSFQRNLFGGIGLGAGVAILEAVSARPCVWASAQFLAFAPLDSTVDLDVRIAAHGRSVTQARVVGHIEDNEIFTVNAALGERSQPESGEFAVRPEVPPPDQCAPRQYRMSAEDTVNELFDVRLAAGRQYSDLNGEPQHDGRSALWVRVVGCRDLSSSPLLGVLGDFVPFGVGQALGLKAGGNSLDNTIRIVRRVPTEWVLLDIRVSGVATGFAHGLVHQWAEDGTLLATCSQSVVLRHHDRGGPPSS